MNCLDAETLAAWFDGGLSGAPLEELRSHVAGCARCQTLVGAMGRTRAAAPPAPERVSRWWLAWAVPAAAAATAVALWVAVPHPTNVADNSLPQPSLQKQQSALRQDTAPPAPRPEAAQPAPATPAASAQTSTLARAPSGKATPPVAAPSSADVKEQKADNFGVALSAPAAPPAERREAAQRQAAGAEQLQLRDTFAAPPCGPMWPAPPSDIAAQITAASAPSADVCWVVGRGGVVLRSTDHETWQRVNIPQAPDLSAISATNARTATVTAADGRTFSTVDGGMSWNQP